MELVIGVVIGLVVGWNVLPQPEFVKNLYEKIKAKVSG